MHNSREVTATDAVIALQLRVFRIHAGLSQEEFASLLGVTYQQVQKYEKGLNRISASRLWEASKVLSMPIGEFFASGGEDDERDELMRLIADRDVAQFVAAFGRISSRRTREEFLALIRCIAEKEVDSSTQSGRI